MRLKDVAITLLGSATCNMAAGAGPTTIFTTDIGKVTRITHVVVRDATATLVAGTSYTITGFRAAFSLAALITVGTGYVVVQATDLTQFTETAGGVAITLTNNTGSGAANAVVDVFGYTTS